MHVTKKTNGSAGKHGTKRTLCTAGEGVSRCETIVENSVEVPCKNKHTVIFRKIDRAGDYHVNCLSQIQKGKSMFSFVWGIYDMKMGQGLSEEGTRERGDGGKYS